MNSVGDHPQGAGFPHSEIHGSKVARTSPWLIAACYVLHRLSVPRHPPDALITLNQCQALVLAHSPANSVTRRNKAPPCVTRACNPGREPPSSKPWFAAHEDTNCDAHGFPTGSEEPAYKTHGSSQTLRFTHIHNEKQPTKTRLEPWLEVRSLNLIDP
jgi:hypothetical protein